MNKEILIEKLMENGASKQQANSKLVNDSHASDSQWIPLKARPATPEEKEDGFPDYMWECKLPRPYQRVLISLCNDKGKGEDVDMTSTGEDDDGLFLDGYSWDDVNAWMPLPDPYKEGK